MDGIKIGLNRKKPGNYAFYCPSSRLHLTLSNPVAYVDRVTSAILVGLRFGTLIDVNGVINLQTGEVSAAPVMAAEKPVEDINTESPKSAAEETAAEKPKTRRTRTKKEEESKEEEQPKEE